VPSRPVTEFPQDAECPASAQQIHRGHEGTTVVDPRTTFRAWVAADRPWRLLGLVFRYPKHYRHESVSESKTPGGSHAEDRPVRPLSKVRWQSVSPR